MSKAGYKVPFFRRLKGVVNDYVQLTKPQIMSLLLFTAAGGAALGSAHEINLLAILITVVGGALAAGGASALNIALETDVDSTMPRTSKRPVVAGRISRRNAIIFGLLLNVMSFVFLALTANFLAASLAILGTVLYVGLYTLFLKRRTWHNIVIGGAAGAVPPLVGYAVATGGLDISAWYLFTIIFFWTPPHFWALALLIKDDYAKANIPMLPVVSSTRDTRLQILLYSVLLAAMTVAFTGINRHLGLLYLVGSIILGLLLVWLAVKLMRSNTRRAAKRLYLYSLLYLFLLFALIIISAGLSSAGINI